MAYSMPIVVEPYFYETWWFYAILILGVLAMIGVSLWNRYQQRLAVERLRTNIATNLHDEVSGLLAGIAMQTDMLEMLVEGDQLKQKLQQIGAVSREAITKMNDVIWSIAREKEKNLVEDLVARMQHAASEVLEPLNIQYKFRFGELDTSGKMDLQDRQDLYMIFRESLNNIAKHSNGDFVEIFFGCVEEHLKLQVQDNGSSDDQSIRLGIESGHNGFRNMERRAQRLHATFSGTRSDEGFTVMLVAPSQIIR